jgi:hypothetical protein
MSLHLIIGYPETGAKGQPVPVYVGRSAAEARAAKGAAKSCACFDEFHNVTPLRKNNPHFHPASAPVETTVADRSAPLELATETAARGRGRK